MVDDPSQYLVAGPCFSHDQHRGLAGTDKAWLLNGFPEGSITPDHSNKHSDASMW